MTTTLETFNGHKNYISFLTYTWLTDNDLLSSVMADAGVSQDNPMQKNIALAREYLAAKLNPLVELNGSEQFRYESWLYYYNEVIENSLELVDFESLIKEYLSS